MEELRIKCPSCGIILDVRNSKNEAVKQIVCPNCKKHLAITFHEEQPKPMQFVDIRMVRLANGSSKTLVRLLADGHIVKVNGQQLQKGDEVVLNIGDELQVDDATSIFGKEGEIVPDKSSEAEPKPLDQKKKQSVKPLVLTLASALILAFVIWLLWPSKKGNQLPPPPVSIADTMAPVKKPSESVLPAKSKSKPQAKPKEQPTAKPSSASLNDYELERQALSGDVNAQYEIGRRWVGRHDSINVVKGIKYLKLAANNSSSEARQALNKVYAALRQSANNGNATAANILQEQR